MIFPRPPMETPGFPNALELAPQICVYIYIYIYYISILPTAYCLLPIARAALCSDSVMPSVMPSQRYALLALCLAGVMPFCARKIYLNTLYLGRFCTKYAICRSLLHDTRRFFSKRDIINKQNTRRRPRLV